MSTDEQTKKDSVLLDEAVAVTETFAQELIRTYDRDQIKQFLTIGAFITQGLQLSECAVLAHMDPEHLRQLMADDVNVATYIRVKQTMLKASLLRVVMARATGPTADAKAAMTMLEKLYASEFNAKAADPSDSRDDNLIRKGIEAIREAGDHTPVVPSRLEATLVAPIRPVAAVGPLS